MSKSLFEIWADKATEPGGINAMADLCAAIESRLSALEEWQKVDSDIHPATPQPVRIRPDIVCPECKTVMRIIACNNCGETIDLSSPIQPVRREWNKGNVKVWAAFQRLADDNKWHVEQCWLGELGEDDLWLPVLSPDEPAPEAPCEVG